VRRANPTGCEPANGCGRWTDIDCQKAGVYLVLSISGTGIVAQHVRTIGVQLIRQLFQPFLVRMMNMQVSISSPTKARGSRLEARISNEQKALFQQAAMLSTRTLSEFVVASAQEAATRIIEAHETIRLEREDQIKFVQALLNPPKPNARLRQAALEYRAMLGV